jgi:protein TonB
VRASRAGRAARISALWLLSAALPIGLTAAPEDTKPAPSPAASPSPGLDTGVLIDQLRNGDAPARAEAALALSEAEPTDEIADEVEWASTRDDDPAVREAAALALAHLRPTPALFVDKHAVVLDAPVKYPPEAFVRKIEGTATVEILINAWGKVVRAELRTSASAPGLDTAAVAAVRKWRFEPAQSNGKPVAERMVVPVVYKIF